jgi:purine-binding chemotaxis protein CheW
VTISSAEARHVLEQRALELARVPGRRGRAGQNYLTFSVGEETFALPVSALLQVLRQPKVVPLPGSALPLIGVTGWRGDLLMVFDIAAVPLSDDAATPYIVVLANDPPLGVRVDEVNDVVEVTTSAIQNLTAARAHRAYARGVTADALVVLDAAALVNSLIKVEAS